MTKQKNRIFSIFIYLFLFLYLITIPYTNAKYLINNYGIVWDNFFTDFGQVTTNFVISDKKAVNSNNLYGAILDENLSSDTVKIHEYDDEYYYVKNSSFSSNYSQYNIGSLKNAEYSVVNQTDEDVVIIFQIHYYSRKIKIDGFLGIGNYEKTLSFGIYNSYERTSADHSISLSNKNDAKNVLKGEVVVNTGNAKYSNPKYSGLPEIVADRLSGSPTEQKVGSNYYYTHRAIINPFAILYDSGERIPYKFKNGDSIEVGINDDGKEAAYTYPAYDSYNTSFANSSLLDDFILKQGESASFVLSLFNGDYGSTDTDNNAFIMAVSMTSIPLTTIKDLMDKIRNNQSYTNYVPVSNQA